MTVRAKPGSGRAAARRAELDRLYPSWQPHSIPSRFAQAACANPDSPLLISETGSFSYAQMDARSRRLASGLVACGVKAGDHVGARRNYGPRRGLSGESRTHLLAQRYIRRWRGGGGFRRRRN